mgnify:CR=1 FL=1
MKITLTNNFAPNTPKSFTEQDSLLLGRSSICDLTCNLLDVSRQHGRIEVANEKVLFSDIGSLNGSHINNKHVPRGEVVELKHGDRIRMGEYWEVEVHIERPELALTLAGEESCNG